jgi:hypothetical protein
MPNGMGLPDEELFAGAVSGKPGGMAGGVGGLLARPGIKGVGAGIFATWLLNKILQTTHETKMRGIQREGLRSQAEMITPESLYFQAAQPAAQEEESMARQALFQQLSGGVLGPSLAKGEYMIGG